MNRFVDVVDALDYLVRAGAVLLARIEAASEHRVLPPLVAASISSAASDLADAAASVMPMKRPRDVIAEEWNAYPFVRLRASVETAALAAAQRTARWDDWLEENAIAMRELRDAWELFSRSVER